MVGEPIIGASMSRVPCCLKFTSRNDIILGYIGVDWRREKINGDYLLVWGVVSGLESLASILTARELREQCDVVQREADALCTSSWVVVKIMIFFWVP